MTLYILRKIGELLMLAGLVLLFVAQVSVTFSNGPIVLVIGAACLGIGFLIVNLIAATYEGRRFLFMKSLIGFGIMAFAIGLVWNPYGILFTACGILLLLIAGLLLLIKKLRQG